MRVHGAHRAGVLGRCKVSRLRPQQRYEALKGSVRFVIKWAHQ